MNEVYLQIQTLKRELQKAERAVAHLEKLVKHLPEVAISRSKDPRLEIDLLGQRVFWKGEEVKELTALHKDIVHMLASNLDIVYSRNLILERTHRDGLLADCDNRAVDSTIKRIRLAFKEVDPDFKAIKTIYNGGYKWTKD